MLLNKRVFEKVCLHAKISAQTTAVFETQSKRPQVKSITAWSDGDVIAADLVRRTELPVLFIHFDFIVSDR